MTSNAKSTLIRVAVAAATFGVIGGWAVAAGPAALTVFQAGQPIRALELNKNFENLNQAIAATNADLETTDDAAAALRADLTALQGTVAALQAMVTQRTAIRTESVRVNGNGTIATSAGISTAWLTEVALANTATMHIHIKPGIFAGSPSCVAQSLFFWFPFPKTRYGAFVSMDYITDTKFAISHNLLDTLDLGNGFVGIAGPSYTPAQMNVVCIGARGSVP